MKNKISNIRLNEKRYYQLLLLSAQSDRTISRRVDEWIDSLPEPQKKTSRQGLPCGVAFIPGLKPQGFQPTFL